MNRLRFVLSLGSMVCVALLGILLIFFGHDLSQTQVVLLTMIASALVSEIKTATSYIFDGTPEKDESPSPAAKAVIPEASASPTSLRISP